MDGGEQSVEKKVCRSFRAPRDRPEKIELQRPDELRVVEIDIARAGEARCRRQRVRIVSRLRVTTHAVGLDADVVRRRAAGRVEAGARIGQILRGEGRLDPRIVGIDGGTGILAGDGALTYGLEKILEVYYDFQLWKGIHAMLDYQFVSDPAYNQDRGPINVLGARFHAEF